MRPAASTRLKVFVLAATVALPLVGLAVAGGDWRSVVQFPPPLRIPTDYVHFSWMAAGLVVAAFGAVIGPWFWRSTPTSAPESVVVAMEPGSGVPSLPRRFPNWGWGALVWTVLCWHLAWTRYPWFAPLQRFTFFPLWLGFIVTVNARVIRCRGSCLMTREPGRWLGLFALSAVCWWTFEWLNRFVQNWHYLGVQQFGPLAYAVHATACFSTVLPAVTAVAEALGGWSAWQRRVATGPAWRWLGQRWAAYALLGFGCIGLIGTGAFPRVCYPALWAAPLTLFLAVELLDRSESVAHEVSRGDWRRAGTWAVAALICGCFWELWNFDSAAKWIYTVPGVERWHVFEMPLLGYLGYLPFGVECLYVAEVALGGKR